MRKKVVYGRKVYGRKLCMEESCVWKRLGKFRDLVLVKLH